MDAAAAQSDFRFSTDDLPVSERLPYLREVLGRSVTRLDLSPVEDYPVKYAARVRLLDGLAVISEKVGPLLTRRSRPLLSDGSDDLVFATNTSGLSLASQVGKECRVDAGFAVLISTAEPGALDFPGPTTSLKLRISRRRLCQLVRTPEDAVLRLIPAATEALRLLIDYVEMTVGRYPVASPDLQRLFATHIHDLVALAIGAPRDAAEMAHDRGLMAARLNAAKGEIARHLEQEALTVTDVALRLGITPRYVQKLFESDGTTFSEYVLKQRLARVYRMLTDTRFLDRTITTLAFDVGFGNLSHFNRAFRKIYGATPSEVRADVRSR
jgi:AraC-like DNA-binding protein